MRNNRFAIKLLAFFLINLLFGGCEKEKEYDEILQDVVFGISYTDSYQLKSDQEIPPECPMDENGEMLLPTIADIILENEEGTELNFTPQVFYLNNKLYSQAIKLPPGTYIVKQFMLLDKAGGTIIMATPSASSAYAAYITPGRTLGFSFEVEEFSKSEVRAEVLCYVPAAYAAFGFQWFNIHQTIIKNFCFFGDICLTQEPSYQEETAYGGDTEGGGSAWWYYYIEEGNSTQKIYAGQIETDGSVTYDKQMGILYIDLGTWKLQDVADPVKIQRYDEIPLTRPASGDFEIKTSELIVNVGFDFNYLVIHLDIEKANPDGGLYNPEAFAGSLYEYVVNGLQLDVPAIFRIDVSKNGQPVPYSPFSNVDLDEDGNPLPYEEQTLNADDELAGTNMPVCAKYPESIGEPDVFTFELYLWVPGPDGVFGFQLFHTFTATDDGPLFNQNGEEQLITEGVLDFVLGDCNLLPPDLVLVW